jgi:hypothetical protein
MLLAVLAVVPGAAAPAQAGQPTRLRLEARTADGLYTDGRRFALVESGETLTILDTFGRTRRRLAETGCRVGGIQFGQAQVSAGRALLVCGFGPALLRLATGTIVPLPARLDVDGIENPADYHAVGAHWAVDEAGHCGSRQGESLYCHVFLNHRTGERRVVRRPYDPDQRSFRDLDDQELARRTVCSPHRDVLRDGQRTYEPPYLLAGGALRRCGRRREVRRLPNVLPDLVNLSAGRVSWGSPFPDGDGRAFLFDVRRQRLFAWRIPRIGRRGRPPVSAVHTRREILIAATLTANREGDPLTVRVYRARLPARPRRARAAAPGVDHRTATVRALRPDSSPQLTIRSGWTRISGVGSAIASPRPRISIPRGRHGSVLARSSITIAARPVRATSRNFLVRSSSWPPTSIVSRAAL